MSVYLRRTLFDEAPPLKHPRRRPESPARPRPAAVPAKPPPCRGCRARNYDPGRFFKWLGCCVWCARDYPTARAVLEGPLPVDAAGCDAAPGSRERMRVYAERAARGQSCFSAADRRCEPEPTKRRGAEGETGVEKVLSKSGGSPRWRARTYFRGKKFMLGSFDFEEEAISVVKAWWKIHGGVDLPKPVLWMPCGDGDRSFAVEQEHIDRWREDFPGVDAARACHDLMMELRKVRVKPGQIEVWNELTGRLAAKAGAATGPAPAAVPDTVSAAAPQPVAA